MSNISFANNTAVYGPDIASYPIRYVINDFEDFFLKDIASSQTTMERFKVSIADYDNQIILIDQDTVIEIKIPEDASLD